MSERDDQRPAPAPARRRWATPAFLAFLLVALAAFGARYHWVEEAGTAERDGYVAEAGEILAGHLPHDPFRPLLYPLAVAGLARLGLAPLAAARLLSNLSAVALVALAGAFGRRLGGRRAGAWALAATAVNPNVWILGQHAATDMLFAALAGGALLAAGAYLERPRTALAVAAGLAYGAAAFARGNALFLLPALVAAWVLAPRRSGPPRVGRGVAEERHRRASHLAAATAAAVLVLLPHWALRWAEFGDPFYDENWKNLAWKLHGYPDWSYLSRVPYHGLAEIVLREPAAIAAGTAAELVRFLAGGLAQLLGTPLHALLFVAGAVAAVVARPREAGWLLASGALFVAAVAASFFAWGRLVLVLLPLGNALAFSLFGDPGRPLWRALAVRLGQRPVRLAAPALAAALVLLLAAKTFAFRLPAFVARHPYVEVATVEALDRELPRGVVLGGTSPFLGRYVSRPYVAIPDAFGAEVEDPGLYFRHLCGFLAARHVGYLVTGPVDLRSRPGSLVGRGEPPRWLEEVGSGGGVKIWRVEPPCGGEGTDGVQ